jgi:glycosyltransferase involved in cell wall biosynthesis
MNQLDLQYSTDNYPDVGVNNEPTEKQALQHFIDNREKEGIVSFGTQCGFAISTYHRNNNRLESFKICISSIMKYKKEDTIVIIVDDGSIVRDHISWVKTTFPSIILIEKEINGGIAKCKNTCLRTLYESNCDVFFLLDDDIDFLQPIENKYLLSLNEKDVSILCGRTDTNAIIDNYSINTNKTALLNGYLLCFTKNTFIKAGYFKVFPYKYGHEHTWYTFRIMKVMGQSFFCDISFNDKYIKLISVESSADYEQHTHELHENEKYLHKYSTDIKEQCIE